jgi:hypothetical protein
VKKQQPSEITVMSAFDIAMVKRLRELMNDCNRLLDLEERQNQQLMASMQRMEYDKEQKVQEICSIQATKKKLSEAVNVMKKSVFEAQLQLHDEQMKAFILQEQVRKLVENPSFQTQESLVVQERSVRNLDLVEDLNRAQDEDIVVSHNHAHDFDEQMHVIEPEMIPADTVVDQIKEIGTEGMTVSNSGQRICEILPETTTSETLNGSSQKENGGGIEDNSTKQVISKLLEKCAADFCLRNLIGCCHRDNKKNTMQHLKPFVDSCLYCQENLGPVPQAHLRFCAKRFFHTDKVFAYISALPEFRNALFCILPQREPFELD